MFVKILFVTLKASSQKQKLSGFYYNKTFPIKCNKMSKFPTEQDPAQLQPNNYLYCFTGTLIRNIPVNLLHTAAITLMYTFASQGAE